MYNTPIPGGEGTEELQLEEGHGELRGEPGGPHRPQTGRAGQHKGIQVTSTIKSIMYLLKM